MKKTRSSENETDDGHSSNTDWDQDSDISIMNGTDEESDTAEIEEEYSHGTDENCKNPMLNQNSQKNGMEICKENRIATGRKMGSESSWMEP